MKEWTEEGLKYLIIENESDLDEVLDSLTEEVFPEDSEVALDLETNGVNEHLATVVNIAFTWTDEGGVCLPLYWYDKNEDCLRPYFSDKVRDELVFKLMDELLKCKLILHNGVFDVACMYHSYGYDLGYDLIDSFYADTMLLKHTVDEEHPMGLKEIGQMKFGEEAIDQQLELKESVLANGGKWNKGNKEMYKADPIILAKYAIKDVILTLQVYDEYMLDLEDQGLEEFFFNKEVMPLNEAATIPMKLHGLYVDVDYFESLKNQLENGIIQLTDEIFEMIQDDIQPKIQELLDKHVKKSRTGEFAKKLLQYYDLPVPYNEKTGKPTLAKKALQSLQSDYPGHEALEWLLWTPTKEFQEIEVEDPETGEITIESESVAVDDPDNPEPKLPDEVVYEVKKEIYVERYPKYPRVFNLGSTYHLSWLIYDVYGEEPNKYSKKTGQPTVDKDSIEQFDLPFIPKLAELRKLEKQLSTYVEPILNKQCDGWIYPNMQQWGTTSGRYSCGGGLNLQTLPRFERPDKCPECESKEAEIQNTSDIKIQIQCPECGHTEKILDFDMIKRGFIAPPGYKVVAADFSSLEPRIFSWVSGDPGLKEVYWKDLDLYSKISIDVFGLEGVSAKKEDDNFLKKVDPEKRQNSKEFTLAVPYGAGAGQIAGIIKKEFDEAKSIIDAYLDSYPGLKEYMRKQEEDAYKTGMVFTEFGRVRHLPRAKELYEYYGRKLFDKKRLKTTLIKEGYNRDEAAQEANRIYYEFRNYMNNAKNFPIQATAAHVTNAALIYMNKLMWEHEIEGWIGMQIHDEIVCLVKEEYAEKTAELLKESMENNWVSQSIDVPMIAEPKIADNFADSK